MKGVVATNGQLLEAQWVVWLDWATVIAFTTAVHYFICCLYQGDFEPFFFCSFCIVKLQERESEELPSSKPRPTMHGTGVRASRIPMAVLFLVQRTNLDSAVHLKILPYVSYTITFCSNI